MGTQVFVRMSLRDRIHLILAVQWLLLVVEGKCEVLGTGTGSSHSIRGALLLVS